MKNSVYTSVLCTLLGAFVLHCTASGTPQEASQLARQSPRAPRATTTYAEGNPFAESRFPMKNPRSSNSTQLRELMSQYKNADRDEQQELENQIRSMLQEQYDAFLVQNEKQIQQLQDRLDNLKEQLDRRRNAKDKMVDLEFERMANEAEGLIWPDRQPDGIFGRAGGGSGGRSRGLRNLRPNAPAVLSPSEPALPPGRRSSGRK